MDPTRNLTGDYVSHSMLHMWRGLISVAYADGYLDVREREYFEKAFEYLYRAKNLTEEQLKILRADLESPQDVFEMLREINDPMYRAHLIDFARHVIRLDGVIDINEQMILDKLHAHVMDGVDLETIKIQARAVINREMSLHNVKMSMNRPQYDEGLGIAAFIDDLLLYFGIDLYR